MTDWRKAHGSQVEKPTKFDTTTSETTVYQRRNIQRVSVPSIDDTVVELWEYEEREMSYREYASILQEQVAANSAAIDDLTIAILEG